MFTKLFAIRIVANNFFGFFNCSITIEMFAFLVATAESIFNLLREKNAISVPEIKADRINKMTSDNSSMPMVKSINKGINMGMGSNECLN